MSGVEIDREQCRKIAGIVKTLDIRPGFLHRPYLAVDSDRETKLRGYLFSAAICHQTHSLWSARQNLKGWEYLEDRFTRFMKERHRLIDPEYLARQDASDLGAELGSHFPDDNDPGKSTLDRLGERADFMIGLSRILIEKYGGKLENLIRRSGNLLLNDGVGIYELLEEMEAFSDPSRKKSTVFVKMAMDASILDLKDPDNIVPMMDYHMQRVLMRMGCVEITDPVLRQKLLDRAKLLSDKDIRDTCIMAQVLIAQEVGVAPVVMNDYFWPLGRSCCHETTLCHDKVCRKSPCTFHKMIAVPEPHDRCVFDKACRGASDGGYRSLWQPMVDTHFY